MNLDAAYDAIHELTKKAVPLNLELTDPDNIENNSSKLLARGWGVKFADAQPSQGQSLDCQYAFLQNVTITNTLQFNGKEEDKEARKRAEKALLADALKILSAVEVCPQPAGDVNLLQFVSNNGIEKIFNDEGVFLMIQTNYSMDISKLRGN